MTRPERIAAHADHLGRLLAQAGGHADTNLGDLATIARLLPALLTELDADPPTPPAGASPAAKAHALEQYRAGRPALGQAYADVLAICSDPDIVHRTATTLRDRYGRTA